MSIHDPYYSSLNTPSAGFARPVAGGPIVPPFRPSSATDGAGLTSEARSRQPFEIQNANIGRGRLKTLFEMSFEHQEQIATLSDRALAAMQERTNNPLALSGYERAYYHWLSISLGIIQHTAERGW